MGGLYIKDFTVLRPAIHSKRILDYLNVCVKLWVRACKAKYGNIDLNEPRIHRKSSQSWKGLMHDLKTIRTHITKCCCNSTSRSRLEGEEKIDSWLCTNGTNGLPLNKAIYYSLLRDRIGEPEAGQEWKTLWKLLTTPKIKIFGRKLLHKKLPTFERIKKFGLRDCYLHSL